MPVMQTITRLSRSPNVLFMKQKKALHEKFNNQNSIALFLIAKEIRKQNQDAVDERCVKDDRNYLSFSNASKKTARKY